MSLNVARAAKSRVGQVFGELVGEEVAVGVTRLRDDGYAVRVNLPKDPGEGVGLPDEVEGVPVEVQVVGRIRKRRA
ncbi:MAG: hypothetical protein ACOC9Q_02315 [bacterium]